MNSLLDRFDYYFKLLILFFVYFITARLGLALDAVSGFATLVWLPTGISLAALFILGFKYWPAIALGAFFANLSVGATPLVAFGIGIGNSLEAIIGAYGLKKLGFRKELDRIQDVLKLVLVVIMSITFSAGIGTASLFFGNIIQLQVVFSTFTAWWIGDLISGLVVSPLIFVWTVKTKIPIRPRRLVEEFAAFTFLFLILLTIFGNFSINNASYIYLVFPPLIWLALRFSQKTSVTAIAIVFLIIVYFNIRGFRSESSISEELIILQSFMSVTAITIMLLSAAITERKNLERKKDEFISVASHELRTPLTSIKLLGQLIQKGFEKKGDKKPLANMIRLNNQVSKLSRLVLELLDMGKIQEGKLKFHKKNFRLDDSVKEVITEMKATTSGNIINKARVKVNVIADRDRVEQVLINLISNAINNSPHKKKVIVEMKKNTKYVTISIQDFGIGIPKSEQRNIFDRFYQIEKNKKNGESSMGLGLYITKEIVERHNGEIWLDSTVGKGSTFYFTLPINKIHVKKYYKSAKIH